MTRGEPRHSRWAHLLCPELPQAAALTLFQRQGPTLSEAFSQNAMLTARGVAGPQESRGVLGGGKARAQWAR